MKPPTETAAWQRTDRFSAHEARTLRGQLTIPRGALLAYVRDHDVTEETARTHLLNLAEEAAVHGSVATKPGDGLMKLTLPRSLGAYRVIVDSRTLTLFAYGNPTGTSETWVHCRNRAAGEAEANEQVKRANEQVKQAQKEARKRRRASAPQAPCLSWDGQARERPQTGAPLRVWRQLRVLTVATMACNRAVADCVYFDTVPATERLHVIQAELESCLATVTESHVRVRPEGFTVERGPLTWHIRRDGRLLEQIMLRRGHATARYTMPQRPHDEPEQRPTVHGLAARTGTLR